MELLEVFLPIDRRHALARGYDLPDRTEGAALFADISGFTPLTAALARDLGPRRGAEELTRSLNTVYDALITEVDRFGGSVIGFAGDAITCWFDSQMLTARDKAADEASPSPPSHSPSTAIHYAVACAQALQQAMSHFATLTTPSGATVSLAMKASVAAGQARRFKVGDPTIQSIDVLAGETLTRMAAAEQLASRGEIIVSAEIVEALGPALAVREWRTDDEGRRFALIDGLNEPVAAHPWTPLPPNALSESALRPWLLNPVYKRLVSGQGAYLAELRPATAMFIRFSGINYDEDDAAGEQLDRFARRVQETILRYEGAMIQITIGDKGSFMYAAFGAPLAHEDPAGGAVAAAIELQALALDSQQIREMQIGISQGTMRVGAYGGNTRRTYGVLGDEVNIAARLMSKAKPGQILVTKRIADLVASRYQLEALGPQMLKGKTEPIPLFAVLRRLATATIISLGPGREAGHPNQALVGRVAEQTLITEQLQALQAAGATEGARVLVITGEAGMGKSRLVEELINQSLALQIRPFVGAAEAIERASPFYAWRPIFSHLLDLSVINNPADRRRHLFDLYEEEPELLRMAPLLNTILLLELPDNELTAQMSGDVRAENTNELLVQFLQNTTRRSPKVVVLEDAQWLDAASWSLATTIARRVPRLLLVVVTRPNDNVGTVLPPEYDELLARPHTIHMPLERLNVREADELACLCLGVTSLPYQAYNLIQQRAQGNPFFCQELAYTLRDTGALTIEGKVCRLAPGADLGTLDFPDTIHGIVTGRIDRIEPALQLTIKVSSVIGREFELPLLRTIHPSNPESGSLEHEIDRLKDIDIVIPNGSAPTLSYLFKHVIIQEVAYSLMLFAQRSTLHDAIARWYERTYASDLSPYLSLLATHWYEATRDSIVGMDLIDKAIDYLSQAGTQALRISAFRDAVGFFERGLRLAQHPSVAAEQKAQAWCIELTCQLGEAWMLQGEYEPAQQALSESLTRASELGEARRIAAAQSRLGRIAMEQGNDTEAEHLLTESLPHARSGGASIVLAYVLHNLGLVAFSRGDYEQAQSFYQEAFTIAQAAGALMQVANSRNNLGNVALMQGDYEQARACYQEVFEACTALGYRAGRTGSLSNLGNVAELQHNYAEAQRCYLEALAIDEAIDNWPGVTILLSNLGMVMLKSNDLVRAHSYLNQALHLAMQIGTIPVVLYTLVSMARLVGSEGQAERAVELLGLAMHHPAGDSEVRDEATAALDEIRLALPTETVEAALVRGQHLQLEQVVEAILAS